MKPKTKTKKKREYEWKSVFLHICGKNLDPDKISDILHIQPDSSGKRGEIRGKRKCKQGYWTLDGGSSTLRFETLMRRILKRISPVKRQLQELIRDDETIKEAHLTIAFAPPRECPNACYCFDAKLINEFTSIGIDIALSIHIIERWEKLYAEVEEKSKKQRRKK